MNTPSPQDILASRLTKLSSDLAKNAERAAGMRLHLANSWLNEEGAKRVTASLARYDALSSHIINEMRALLVPPVARSEAANPVPSDALLSAMANEFIRGREGLGRSRVDAMKGALEVQARTP